MASFILINLWDDHIISKEEKLELAVRQSKNGQLVMPVSEYDRVTKQKTQEKVAELMKDPRYLKHMQNNHRNWQKEDSKDQDDSDNEGWLGRAWPSLFRRREVPDCNSSEEVNSDFCVGDADGPNPEQRDFIKKSYDKIKKNK